MTTPNGTPVKISFEGTAAAHLSKFVSYQSDAAVIGRILVNNGPGADTITLTAKNVADYKAVFAKLYQKDGSGNYVPGYSLVVSDTAANIKTYLKDIHLVSQPDSVVVTNNAILSLTAKDVASYGQILALLTNANGSVPKVEIVDTGANISANLQALYSIITGATTVDFKLKVSDNGPIQISMADLFGGIGGMLVTKVIQDATHTLSFSITGTVIEVMNSLGGLGGLNSIASKITLLTVLDTAAEIAGNLSPLGGVTFPYELAVADTAASIGLELDRLLQKTADINSITVTDNAALPVTIAQITSAADILGKLKLANGSTDYKLSIVDTAANIGGKLAELQVNTRVASIVVTDSADAIDVPAGAYTSLAAILGKLSGAYSLALTETAAMISANLDQLKANGHIGSITISDNGFIKASALQVASDASVLAVITQANGGAYRLLVTDTAANVAAKITELAANGHVHTITLTDPGTAMALTAGKVAAGESLWAKLATSYTISVVDTAANIAANMDELQEQAAHISTITLSNPGATLAIKATQIVTAGDALGKIASSYTLAVSDTAASISSLLDTLQASVHLIASVTVSDDKPVPVTIAQISANAAILDKLQTSSGSSSYSLAAVDTAANVSALLESLNANTHIAKVTVSDGGPIALTIPQITANAGVLAKLHLPSGDAGYSLAVWASAAELQANLALLSANGHVGSITLYDPATPIALSVAEMGVYAGVLARITTDYTLSVSGSAAEVVANIDALDANIGHIASIPLTDSGGTISIRVGHLSTAADVLAKITGTYSLVIADTAANIAAGLAVLEANVGSIASITVTDTANPIPLSFAQYQAGSAALGLLTGTYSIAVSDTAATILANIDVLRADGNVSAILVVDSVANVLPSLDTLLSLTHAVAVRDTTANIALSIAELQAHVGDLRGGIERTDPATALEITTAELASSQGAIALIASGEHLSVRLTGSWADVEMFVLSPPANVTFASPHIVDSAANLTASLAFILANGVASVTVSDNAPLTVTAEQAVALASILRDADGSASQLLILDTAESISANLGALNQLAVDGVITEVTISDSASVPLQGVHQITSVAALLALLENADGSPQQLHVHGTAAEINASIDILASVADRIGAVTITDSRPLTLTATGFHDAIAVLTKTSEADGDFVRLQITDFGSITRAHFDELMTTGRIVGLYVHDGPLTLTASQLVNGETLVGVLGRQYYSEISCHDHGYSLVINDSAANVGAALGEIDGNGHVVSIVLTDPGALIPVSIATLHDDSNMLPLVAGGYSLNVVDSSANIGADMNMLWQFNAHTVSITLTDPLEPVPLTVSHYFGLSVILDKIDGPWTAAIVDTSLTISGSISQIHAEGARIASISLSDPGQPVIVNNADQLFDYRETYRKLDGGIELSVVSPGSTTFIPIDRFLDIADLIANATEYQGGGAYTANVTGTAADISARFHGLAPNGDLLGKIFISDNGTLSLSVGQLVDSPDILAHLAAANGELGSYTLALSGTAADISAHWDVLAANGHILSVTITDAGTLAITSEQLAGDAAFLATVVRADGLPLDLSIGAGSGDDVVHPGANAGKYFGNGGSDTLDYSDSRAGVHVALSNRNDGLGGNGYALRATTEGEGFFGTPPTGPLLSDKVTGFSHVEATAYNDRLYGHAGDNVFAPGAGSDIVYGKGGSDTVDYSGKADGGVYVSLSSNPLSPTNSSGYVLEAGGGTGFFSSGTASVVSTDYVIGISNAFGTDRNDRFYGNTGDNLFRPGGNSDIAYGGGGKDTIDYSDAVGSVLVNLAGTFAYEAYNAGASYLHGYSVDRMYGFSNVNGSSFGDRLYGTSGDNVIAPGAGDDIVYGLGGTDTIDYSGSKAGVLVNLGDRYAYEATTAGMSFLDVAAATAAGYSTDQIYGFSNANGTGFGDRLYGTSGNNVLAAGAGDDFIYGLGGDDVLVGGEDVDRLIGGVGHDTLTGGDGADRFYIVGADQGFDTITDFTSGTDHLYLSAGSFGYAVGGTVSIILGVGTSDEIFGASTDKGFAFDALTGSLSFDADGSGTESTAVKIAELSGGAIIWETDVVLY